MFSFFIHSGLIYCYREFLSGFHKRKLQRKKKAQEELAEQLKAERKRLKQEAKESYKKLTMTYKPIPELEHLNATKYEDNGLTVQVLELSSNAIAEKNSWIVENRPQYESNDESEEDVDENEPNADIEGMSLKHKKVVKEKSKPEQVFNSEKDLKRVLKKQATKNVQKSKAFQLKYKLEKQKMRKKSMQQKKLRFKEKRKH